MSGGFTSDWLLRQQIRAGLSSSAGKRGIGRPAPPDEGWERETDLHRAILDECKARGWRAVYSNPTKPTTCGEGVCDFIIYADGGRVFNIECKRTGGKLSMEQNIFITWLAKLGHTVHVINSLSEFLEIVPRGVPQTTGGNN